MFSHTFAVLIIVMALISLAILVVSQIAPFARKTALLDETQQPQALHPARRPTTLVMILGNLITALVYVMLYGIAAGSFN